MQYIFPIFFLFSQLIGCQRQNDVISLSATQDIDLISDTFLIQNMSPCLEDSRLDRIFLIKVHNSTYDTILLPTVPNMLGRWYLPESVVYFEEKANKIYGGSRRIGFNHGGSFDTLYLEQTKYYCIDKHEILTEFSNYTYGQFSFPYYLLDKTVKYKMEMLINFNSTEKMDFVIPTKTIVSGDKVMVSRNKVLEFSDNS